MTNWFKKLNISIKDLEKFFNKKFGNYSDVFREFKVDEDKIVVKEEIGQYGECGSGNLYYICTPFYIKKMFNNRNLATIDRYMEITSENSPWTSNNRLSSKDFSYTPKKYYELFLSKCNDEERAQYMSELQETFNKCVKEEIALLEDKANEIKREFDKEIIARKRMLRLSTTKNIFESKGSSESTTIAINDDDIENQ